MGNYSSSAPVVIVDVVPSTQPTASSLCESTILVSTATEANEPDPAGPNADAVMVTTVTTVTTAASQTDDGFGILDHGELTVAEVFGHNRVEIVQALEAPEAPEAPAITAHLMEGDCRPCPKDYNFEGAVTPACQVYDQEQSEQPEQLEELQETEAPVSQGCERKLVRIMPHSSSRDEYMGEICARFDKLLHRDDADEFEGYRNDDLEFVAYLDSLAGHPIWPLRVVALYDDGERGWYPAAEYYGDPALVDDLLTSFSYGTQWQLLGKPASYPDVENSLLRVADELWQGWAKIARKSIKHSW